MKKKVKALGCIFLALCLTVLSGCQAVNPDREKSYDTATLGKFINCSSVTPSEAVTTINNQGMSGLRSSIHLHSDDASDAYISDHKPVLVYDLETVQRLGYLYIWNLNAEGMLDCGLKEIDVEYSVDGKSWTKLTKKPIVLAKASADENKEYAGNAANNQNDGKRTPIDFGGVNARYVRITALSNYGGSKYGLSEVRFFSYKVRPKNGSEIMAFSTAPNATEKSENIANGLNINGDKISDSADTSWSAPVGRKIKNNFIFIDLDGSYPVEKVRIYNYNVKGQYDCGLEKFTIQYCTERPNELKVVSVDYVVSYNGCDWVTLEESVTINQSNENGCGVIDIDFHGEQVQYIKIIPESNYGGDNVGLSAVQIFASNGIATVPEYEWSGLLSNEGSFPYQQSLEMGREGEGWLGADGIYSVNLNGADTPGSANEDTRTMFIFSDTFMGNFNNYSGDYGIYGKSMNTTGGVNHSFAYLLGSEPDPRNLSFWMHSGEGNGNIIAARDWLTDLVCIDKKVYLYGMRFNSVWMPDFMDLVEIELDKNYMPKLEEAPQMREHANVMFEKEGYTYVFGAGIFDNTKSAKATPNPDGYIYVYGYRSQRGSKKPIVARTKPENFENEEKWEFYNGERWVKGIENTEIIGNIEVSSEFSVQYVSDGVYAGKFVLCFTEVSESGNIMISVADSVTGVFDYENTKTIYHCNELIDLFPVTGDKAIYSYNAKCHPHLSDKGEMLISYNVNTHDYDLTAASREYLYPHFVVMYEIQ